MSVRICVYAAMCVYYFFPSSKTYTQDDDHLHQPYVSFDVNCNNTGSITDTTNNTDTGVEDDDEC